MSDNEVFDGRCYTEEKIERGRFVWKISGFSKRTEILKSVVFPSSAPNYMGKWCIWLYPYGGDSRFRRSHQPSMYEPHTSILIYQQDDIEIWASVKFSLINDKGILVKNVVIKCRKYFPESDAKIEKFVERAYVLNKDNGVLPNDELTILCEIEIKRSSENRYRESVPAKLKLPLCRLVEDLGNLLSSESLTDLTITVAERQFRAHKAILAARSPVFAAMFRNEMEEKKSNVVDITDIDPDVFEELLEYIYTGKAISQTKRTEELLVAANKYELERLKFMCEDVLCKDLSVDNVLETIVLADCYNAFYLKEHAIQFVTRNTSDVIGSLNWLVFKRHNQVLVMEILEKIGLL